MEHVKIEVDKFKAMAYFLFNLASSWRHVQMARAGVLDRRKKRSLRDHVRRSVQPSGELRITRAAYKEAGPHYGFRTHTNSDYQWYAVLAGQVVMEFDGEEHVLDPEHSILFPPGFYRAPRAGRKPPCYFYVRFRNDRLDLKSLPCRVMATPPDLRPDLLAIAAELRHPPDINSQALLEALTVRMLVGLNRAALQTGQGQAPVLSSLNVRYHEHLVQRVETFMTRNLHRRLACAELAGVAHVSAPHLNRLFRAVRGKPTAKRLVELRLALARELLLNSTMSVSEVALESGHASFSHFAHQFKVLTGVAPSAYRRANGHIWGR